MNTAVLAFDNCSGVTARASDLICRLSTGSGFATRQLYTDRDEIVFDERRPVILNGIATEPDRHDLIDRAIVIHLRGIEEENRLDERTLREKIACLKPEILGALYDAIAVGLAKRDGIDPAGLPRMADFARLIIAAEEALPWEEGRFLRAYRENRAQARAGAIYEEPVARALLNLLRRERIITGITASGLLAKLRNEVMDPNELPHSESAFGRKLRRLETALNSIGVFIEHRRSSDARTMNITLRPEAQGE
jgi:hypothetical protein